MTSVQKKHIESAEYHRDYCLALADIARLNYRKYQKFEYFKEWKDNIREAWSFRKMANRYKREVYENL